MAIDGTSLVCILLCALAFGFWTVDLTHSLSPAAGAFFLVMPFSIFYLGRGVLRWLNLAAMGQPFAPAFVVGSFAACLLLFFMDFISPVAIQWNGLSVFIIAILVQLIPSRVQLLPENRHDSLLTVLAVIVTLTAATFWTRDLRPYASQVGNEVVFRPWNDYFFHAQMVGQVRADQNLLQLGNPNLAGLPLPFYHYASYIFPACVSACTGQTAYDSLVTFWTPFGILLTGLAAYMLGGAWWSSRAGLAALMGLVLMPDASTYGIQDAYYSYHWLVVSNPGLLYGIAAAAVALLFATRGILPTNWRRLGAGFGLVMMCILLKAQLFVAVCPLFVTWVVLFKEGWTRRQRLSLSLGLLTVGWAVLMMADRYDIGPTIIPFGRNRDLATYLQGLAAQLRDPVHDVMRVVMSGLGVPGLVLPVMALFCYYRQKLEPVDAVPGLAMLIYLVCAILLPFNSGMGTPDELRHRTFAWAYFVVTVWTWGKLFSILDTFSVRAGWQTCLSAIVVVASIALLAWPWTRGASAQDPRLWWSDKFINVRLALGRVESARFLRDHAAEGDIVQEAVTSDIPILGALAERRCYLTLYPAFMEPIAPKDSVVEERRKRAELVRRIGMATTRSDLHELISQTHIRWYVSHTDEKLAWPNDILSRPAFRADGYRVFDLNMK